MKDVTGGWQSDSSERYATGLLVMARPEIYRLNSFRVLGIPVTASSRDVSSRMRKLDLTEKLGNTREIERGFLSLSWQADRDARQEAHRRLTDPESRLVDEILWFWRVSPDGDAEDEAYAAMEQNDLSNAVAIWKRQERQSDGTDGVVHNLAVIHHVLALDLEVAGMARVLSSKQVEQKKSYWQEAISRWRILLEQDGFWRRVEDRIHELDDPRLTTVTLHKIRKDLPLMILLINAILGARAARNRNPQEASFHLELMANAGFDKSLAQEALRRAVTPIRDQLRMLCTKAEAETKKAPQSADRVARGLLDRTVPLLSALNTLFEEDNAIRRAAHDEVAAQVLDSAASFSNETKDWKASLALLQRALQIGVNASLHQRIKTHVEIGTMNLAYGTCWFCKNSPSEEEAGIEVKMYGNVTTYGGIIRWQHFSAKVPRCRRCKSVHGRKTKIGWLGALLGLGLAIVIGSNVNGLAGFLTFVVGLTIGLVAGRRRPKGIREEGYKREFPNIQKLVSEGWAIGDKPPQAN